MWLFLAGGHIFPATADFPKISSSTNTGPYAGDSLGSDELPLPLYRSVLWCPRESATFELHNHSQCGIRVLCTNSATIHLYTLAVEEPPLQSAYGPELIPVSVLGQVLALPQGDNFLQDHPWPGTQRL